MIMEHVPRLACSILLRHSLLQWRRNMRARMAAREHIATQVLPPGLPVVRNWAAGCGFNGAQPGTFAAAHHESSVEGMETVLCAQAPSCTFEICGERTLVSPKHAKGLEWSRARAS